MMTLLELINLFAYSLLGIWLIVSLILCVQAGKTPQRSNPFILQFIPGLFTTLGIFGTFLGIAFALYQFDTTQIEQSIPTFLEGMKTAFVTSVIGMSLSIVFSFWTKFILKKHGTNIPVPESDETKSLKILINESKESKEALLHLTKELSQTRTAFVDSNQNSSQTLLLEIKKTNEQLLLTSKLAQEDSKAMVKTLNSNHKLMEQKFGEFAELLASANTDALREAMQTLVSDFNDTFRNLITNLINQNFEELNESVKNLNTWQQQYRSMIQELIAKLDQTAQGLDAVAVNIKATQENTRDSLTEINTTLANVSDHTKDLVSSEGKLAAIVKALTTVLVDENKLSSAFDKAVNAMENLRSSSAEFEETKKQITNWLNKEQGIAGAMTLFNHGIAELSSRLQTLQGVKLEELKLLDNSFDKRLQTALNTSFGHLDALIKEYVSFLEKSRKIEILVNDKSNGKV